MHCASFLARQSTMRDRFYSAKGRRREGVCTIRNRQDNCDDLDLHCSKDEPLFISIYILKLNDVEKLI